MMSSFYLNMTNLRGAFEQWCREYCSAGADSSEWYWRLFKAGAEAALRGAAHEPAARNANPGCPIHGLADGRAGVVDGVDICTCRPPKPTPPLTLEEACARLPEGDKLLEKIRAAEKSAEPSGVYKCKHGTVHSCSACHWEAKYPPENRGESR